MRKHNYVVGYLGEGNVAYSKDNGINASFIELLTFKEAKKEALNMVTRNGNHVSKAKVFKLVPVYPLKKRKHNDR